MLQNKRLCLNFREDVKNQEAKNEGRGIWKDKWEKDDLILTYYFSTYGTKGLGLTDRELAQDIIGSSLNSLKMQASNYDHLKGLTGLDRPHSTQTEVYDEFHDKTQGELMKICRNIIDKKGGGDGKVFQDKIRQRNMKKDLDNELAKRGFDPKKMKSLGTRPTLQSMLEEPEELHEQKKHGKCKHCTQKKKNIGTYRVNPFLEDVDGVTKKEYICDPCYQNLKDDI